MRNAITYTPSLCLDQSEPHNPASLDESSSERTYKTKHGTTATMSTRTWPELERDAIAAHRSGMPWDRFWPTVAADVRELQAHFPDAHRTLYGRLLALVVSGDEDGQEPPVGLPWTDSASDADTWGDTAFCEEMSADLGECCRMRCTE